MKELSSVSSVKLPQTQHLDRIHFDAGTAASIIQVDISCAFRHICIDPGDIDSMGISHRDKYYSIPYCHLILAWNLLIFLKRIHLLRYIMTKNGHDLLFNYIAGILYDLFYLTYVLQTRLTVSSWHYYRI